jgi:hypothetical protein
VKELRLYKTRPKARVAIMRFYADNKDIISKVYPAYKSQGVLMKNGSTIYFRSTDQETVEKYNSVKFYQ